MGNNETKTIGVFYTDKNRKTLVMEALMESIIEDGNDITSKYEKADIVITFGLSIFSDIHERARKENKPNILIDLGYWERNYEMLSKKNHYRLSVQHPQPSNYIMHMGEDPERFLSYKKTIQPWKMSGDYILLADIGQKSYDFFDMEYQSWAKKAIIEIQKHTDRPIIYRAKPSSFTAKGGLPGIPFSDPFKEPIEKVLKNAYAAVTYHSNVGCDALLAGVPIFIQAGAALHMGLQDLSKIETPFYPTNRFSFFCNLAYCQWNVNEMRQGLAWKHLKEKLIPLVYEKT